MSYVTIFEHTTKVLPEDGAAGAETCSTVLIIHVIFEHVRFVGVLKIWLSFYGNSVFRIKFK